MSDELNRRNFIEDSGCMAASTAGIATWPALHPAVRTARGEAVAPSETIRVAFIGCGGQGSSTWTSSCGLRRSRSLLFAMWTSGT